MILSVLFADAALLEDEAVVTALLDSAPRAGLEPSRAWLDVRGLDARSVWSGLRRRLEAAGAPAGCGAATRPVAAELAAVQAARASAGALVYVEPGAEREFLAPLPLAWLGLADPLLGWLADVGVLTCGELAAVAREAIEVRFGAEAVRWWQLARAQDERRLFAPVPPAQPSAAVDFIDYVVTDPERLIFTTNALLTGVCEQLRERGEHARRIRLRLALANGAAWERTLRSARPTADRSAWLRLSRLQLERLTVPDAVAGVAVTVAATEAAGSVQGDLFDTGFATASAVEAAVARLLEDQGEVLREPIAGGHTLAERRAEYRPLSLHDALQPSPAPRAAAHLDAALPPAAAPRAAAHLDAAPSPAAVAAAAPEEMEPVGLTLQLLPQPRAVVVETVRRRDHEAPTRYRDGGWHALRLAAGPDRVSGDQWDAGYAREYYRAVRADGTLVWLFRDACTDRWYLHGWWD